MSLMPAATARQSARIICICGRPLAGKTTAAQILQAEHGWRVIEADQVGEMVLPRHWAALPPLEKLRLISVTENAGRRCEYPYCDAQRMEWERPDEFWEELLRQIQAELSPSVVVGLRSAQMLRRLKATFRRRAYILYVAAGTRVCAARYTRRTHSPLRAYSRLLRYAVEADRNELHELAGVVVRNASSPDAFRQRLLARVRPDGRVSRGTLEQCSCCGELTQVHARDGADQRPICQRCYEVRYNTEQCSRCGRWRPVHQRDSRGAAICKNCYQKVGNVQPCAACGRPRTVYRRDVDGRPLCKNCSRRLP